MTGLLPILLLCMVGEDMSYTRVRWQTNYMSERSRKYLKIERGLGDLGVLAESLSLEGM